MPHVRKAREDDLKDCKIIQAEYGKIESLERNHVSSISTAHSNIGYLLTLVVNLSVLLPHQGIRLAITSLSAWLIYVSFLLCHSIVLTNIGRQGRPRHMVVHLPATPPQSKAPKRKQLPHNRLETSLACVQINPAPTPNIHLPRRILPARRWPEHNW
jgi:hypothetical protein